MADAKECVAVIEILQGHRSLADTYRLGQADACRLVTHVRAIGKVVGSVFPRKQLIEKSRLIGRPAGRIKLRHIGVRQRTERGADLCERLVPRNREVSVSRLVIDHRMREAALILQIEVRPFPELIDRVCGKEFRGRPFGGRFPCDGFGAVLAELKRGGMFRIGPGAARAIEPMRLVHAEETAGLLYDIHLTANGIRDRFESTPSRCGALVLADAYDIVFAHCALHRRGDVWPGDTSRIGRMFSTGDSPWTIGSERGFLK